MAPRPRMFRRVHCRPDVTHFKPAGIPLGVMESIELTMEEFESIRLMDREDMKQTEACKKMGVSQPTFQRIYGSARKKIAEALVDGKAIRIEGGHYKLMGPAGRGMGMRGFGRCRGRGMVR